MRGALAAVLGAALALAGSAAAQDSEVGAAPGPLAQPAPPALVIVGSDYTMPRFTERWAAAFQAAHGVPVEVDPSGSATGPPALLSGRAALASMTRPLHPDERAALREHFGVDPVAIPVALDALAIWVNTANPLPALTLQQVDAIFSRDRLCGARAAVQRWGELGVGGDLATRRLSLYGRAPKTGTAAFFAQNALCGGTFHPWMRASPGGESALRGVAESPFAIGFAGTSEAIAGVRSVPLAREAGEPPVPATPENIAAGRYPLTRTLLFYAAPSAGEPLAPALRDFVAYALSDEGQAVVAEEGFVPIPPERRAAALAALQAAADGGSASADAAPGASD